MAFNSYNKTRFTSDEQAILTTILYSDIFEFPLTQKELWRLLISKKKIEKRAFTQALDHLSWVIIKKDGYYCLKGKQEIVSKRVGNLSEVKAKLILAKKVALRLSVIPTISFIGISGGLAVGNVTAADDIDLFIIVKKNTLFSSRFWIVMLLELLHVRRFPRMRNTANTICVNLLIDETSLTWPTDKHDLYTAREIAQIQPLFEREKMYRIFLQHNQWIKNFLPNAFESLQAVVPTKVSQKERIIILEKIGIFLLFEHCMRLLQIAYMKRRQTTEMVTKHQLAFHPKDYRAKTLSQLKLKLRQFGLLTNL